MLTSHLISKFLCAAAGALAAHSFVDAWVIGHIAGRPGPEVSLDLPATLEKILQTHIAPRWVRQSGGKGTRCEATLWAIAFEPIVVKCAECINKAIGCSYSACTSRNIKFITDKLFSQKLSGNGLWYRNLPMECQASEALNKHLRVANVTQTGISKKDCDPTAEQNKMWMAWEAHYTGFDRLKYGTPRHSDCYIGDTSYFRHKEGLLDVKFMQKHDENSSYGYDLSPSTLLFRYELEYRRCVFGFNHYLNGAVLITNNHFSTTKKQPHESIHECIATKNGSARKKTIIVHLKRLKHGLWTWDMYCTFNDGGNDELSFRTRLGGGTYDVGRAYPLLFNLSTNELNFRSTIYFDNISSYPSWG